MLHFTFVRLTCVMRGGMDVVFVLHHQLVADASLRRTLVALNRVMRDCVASNRVRGPCRLPLLARASVPPPPSSLCALHTLLMVVWRCSRRCALQNAIGFNRAGLRMLKRRIENQGQDGQAFGDDQPEVVEESKVVSGRGKRRRYQLF